MSGVRPRTWLKGSGRRPSRGIGDERLEPFPRGWSSLTEVSEHAPRSQKRPGPLEAEDGQVATPSPFGRVSAEAGSYGVQCEIPRELEKVPVALHEHRVESALEDVTVQRVNSIEGLSESPVEPLHPIREIACRCLEDEVIVIRHQAVAEAAPLTPLRELVEEVKKQKVVVSIDEDLLSSVSATRHVEDAVRKLNSLRPWHECSLERLPRHAPEFQGLAPRLLAFFETSGVRPRAWPLWTRPRQSLHSSGSQ